MNTIAQAIEASSADLARIEQLMQFYNYDLSEWCPLALSGEGRYTIRSKQAYWATATVKPYLLRVGGELAGFAVVDREVRSATTDFNMGYFFLARRFRGRGLGSHLARDVLQRHRGQWEIYHHTGNLPASRLWPNVIAAVASTLGSHEAFIADGLPATLHTFSNAAKG